jgi:hypothetical protein
VRFRRLWTGLVLATTVAVPLSFAAGGGARAASQVSAAAPAPVVSGISPGAEIYGQSPADLGRELDGIVATGARYVRLDLPWSWVQTGPTTWDWSGTDRVIGAALARGLQVDALVGYAPSWETGQAGDKHAPANASDFGNFVYQAGLRYVPQGVTTWEIWNEPNITSFLSPTSPAIYTNEILRPGANAIRAAAAAVHGAVTVLSGGLAPSYTDASNFSPIDFLTGIYGAGGRGLMDAVALHPYSWPYAPMTAGSWNTFANTPALYQVMANNGDGGLKIWGTEWGYPTGSCSSCVSEAVQAQFVTVGFAQWRSWGFTGPLFVYSYHDATTDASDPESNFGLVRFDFTPKAALAAFTVVNGGQPQATTASAGHIGTAGAPATTLTTAPPSPGPASAPAEPGKPWKIRKH